MRDGRSLAHNTLEEMRILVVQCMAEGEHPDDVAASFGMNRSWAQRPREIRAATPPRDPGGNCNGGLCDGHRRDRRPA